MKPFRTSHHRSNSAAFSLIELLTVVMIIGILAGFVVPAVNGMGRGSALTNSGNTVVDLVNYARQEAMTKNTMTALVLLGHQGADEDYRALTVLEYDPASGWSQIMQWEILPPGIVVDCNDTANCTFLTHSPQPFPFLTRVGSQSNPPVKYQGNQVADQSGYAARIFLPNGSLQNPEQPAQLRIVEGFYNGSGVTYTSHAAIKQAANYYDVAILGMTGTAKINRP